jgi:hypothetical protein
VGSHRSFNSTSSDRLAAEASVEEDANGSYGEANDEENSERPIRRSENEIDSIMNSKGKEYFKFEIKKYYWTKFNPIES